MSENANDHTENTEIASPDAAAPIADPVPEEAAPEAGEPIPQPDFPPEMTPYMKAWIRAHADWIAKELSIHKTGATVADRATLNP